MVKGQVECRLQLKNFEGPLDLLDELIGSSKLDITEIELAQVTEQYLTYLKAMKDFDIDLASEFFVVAAMLIYSKTRQLMPKPIEDTQEIFDEQDLLCRLQEYRYFKQLARGMDASWSEGLSYFTRGKLSTVNYIEAKQDIDELTIGDLLQVVIRYKRTFLPKVVPIKKRFITVEQKMIRLIALFMEKSEMRLSEIMCGELNKPDKIATFLGITDMTYHQKIIVIQNFLFEDFSVIKKPL